MASVTRRRPWRRSIVITAAATAVALGLAACSSSASNGAGAGAGAKSFTYLGVVEDATTPAFIKTLSTGACSAENKALPYQYQSVPQANIDQKLQLLGGQNALPAQYAAGQSPVLTTQLLKSGQLKDLTNTPVADEMLPAAQSTIKALYGGKIDTMPYQLNIEGFWYNKQIFAKEHIAVPTTWDEMVADAAKLQAAGYQPFATGAAGGQGWPITRLISGYLFRELGPTAMSDIASGKAKLTDPAYVKGAAAVADLGKKGYFGKAPGAADYNAVYGQFLTGKAAMFYMGSWALANFADKSVNKIGEENIGLFPVPAVDGGKGTIDQWPANVGLPTGIAAKGYNSKVQDWTTCIGKNYGKTALAKGSISGFKVNGTVPSVAPLTAEVQKTIAGANTTVQWFETFMDSKQTLSATNNVVALVTGKMSPQSYMQTVQSAAGQ